MREGFVYLWKDTKRGKFYLGSHHGSLYDGYVGSSKRFISAYKSRPDTFRRRILEYYKECSREFLRERETAWLSLIDPQDLTTKYYNEKIVAAGGDIYTNLSDESKRLFRLKSNSRIRSLLATGIDINKAETIIDQENIQIRLSKKKPGETWLGRRHTLITKEKQSKYKTENPAVRENFSQSEESKHKLRINNPKRKSIRTPLGDFYSAEEFCNKHPVITPNGLRIVFKNLDTPITQRRAERCPLITKLDIGNTFRELGYTYIKDTDVNK